MTCTMFVGPTRYGLPERAVNDAALDVRPPVRRGDLHGLAAESPPGYVAIVDGLFHQELAVAHWEVSERRDSPACRRCSCTIPASAWSGRPPGSPYGRPLAVPRAAGLMVVMPGWLEWSVRPLAPGALCDVLLLDLDSARLPVGDGVSRSSAGSDHGA